MTDLERVRNIAVALWKMIPEKERLHMERHPVNDVSNVIDAHLKEDAEWKKQAHDDYAAVQAELARLREERDQLEKMRYDAALEAEEALEDNDRLRGEADRLRKGYRTREVEANTRRNQAEAELARLREENEELRRPRCDANEDHVPRTQRDTLLAALREMLADVDKYSTVSWGWDSVEQARVAISEVEEGDNGE